MLENKKDRHSTETTADQNQRSTVNNFSPKKEENISEETFIPEEEETNQKRRFSYIEYHAMPSRRTSNGRESNQ